MSTALAGDEAGAFRQFGLVDGSGASAAHTGRMHAMGRTDRRVGMAIIGNMLAGPEVLRHNGRGVSAQRVSGPCRAPDVGS